MKAPFPWYGGKRLCAPLVWSRFGDVSNYVEPFFGSGAVLLSRPHQPRAETINDKDCMVSNFWRAVAYGGADEVARWCDWPVNEADLHARHLWLVNRVEFRERMKTDPHYYDAQVAGWWVWGISQWIGGGWCTAGRHWRQNVVKRSMPNMKRHTAGVHRKRMQLRRGTGAGIHANVSRRMPKIDARSGGVQARYVAGDLSQQIPDLSGLTNRGMFAKNTGPLYEYFECLANRLRRVRVCCGDWQRICGPSPTYKIGLTGVFLDPPYSEEAGRDPDLYSEEDLAVAHDVRKWCIENGENELLRIALCGLEGEHDMPANWECIPWTTNGGYGNRSEGGARNKHRERIWFSPHCIKPSPNLDMFGVQV